MILLPYENFYIKTKLLPREIATRIRQRSNSTKRKFSGLFEERLATYFEGYATDEEFKLKRNIYYRNHFLPCITGTIEEWQTESRIHIKMRMSIIVIIFMCLWLGGLSVASFGLLAVSLTGVRLANPDLIIVGMFLFGYSLMMGCFKFESMKAKAYLLELLEGKIE